LLNNARKNGAEVHEQVRVTHIDLNRDDHAIVKTVDREGTETTYSARFVIDASGREAMIGAQHRWRKPREELDRAARWSHWDGVVVAGGLEEGISLIIYLGEEKKGWIWVFPLSEIRITAGIVMQNSYMREQRRKLRDNGSTHWVQDLAMQELMLS